jgi:hypothetical protein
LAAHFSRKVIFMMMSWPSMLMNYVSFQDGDRFNNYFKAGVVQTENRGRQF